ncbi:hypothetical protein GQ42DRAFT_114629, partial [Ramicandelaber brevisporus]
VRRGRTLVRHDRRQQPHSLFSSRLITAEPTRDKSAWVIYSRIISFWAPSFLLRKFGLAEPAMRQAWREKIALCFIVFSLCIMVVYMTMFLQNSFCSAKERSLQDNVIRMGVEGYLGWFGIAYAAAGVSLPAEFPVKSLRGQDVTPLFMRDVSPDACNSTRLPAASQQFAAAKLNPCQTAGTSCPFGNFTAFRSTYGLVQTQSRIGYDWIDVKWPMIVVDGNVLNLEPYISAYPSPLDNDLMDTAIRIGRGRTGYDATRYFYRLPVLRDAVHCVKAKYYAGKLAKATVGCFSVNLFNLIALFVIASIVFARFFMALAFSWFLSWSLVKRPTTLSKRRPVAVPQGMPWAATSGSLAALNKRQPLSANQAALLDKDMDELFTVMLVTCYSEGEASVRSTVESLAATSYHDSRKLLFVVADGIITGSGNDRSTPDICIDLIEQDPELINPQPCSYIAVAAGTKQLNMARVYAGWFSHKGHRVATVVVVKCGSPAEEGKPKPGNRGKRDSQVILMNFFSRVVHNDRMTPLDYDLFYKIHKLMGITPDYFELVLMVDADTKVYPDSLQKLVNCMQNDEMIMGLCGETKIANKRDSWVTAIQVFEYYISHHLGKAFESVFGGVTCLPGCFCMYRLKARKGDNEWVPILTNPEILQEYQQNVVETLHEKNLLLLGEDRFLTTLMLRTFPKRKMVFMPQAICKTVVPDTFKVLLSQRRRWINSTIHNLLELVLVRNLCGTFCFSMQFVIFMELIGTTVLPAAVVMTYVLVFSIARASYTSLASFLPLVMLIMVLFLPGILILITTRKWIYIGWMFIYLLALPIWNFVLPVYAYWHFDDFSWGETRKVDGEAKDHDHSRKSGEFDGSKVPLRRWEDYERRRLR